MSERYKEWNQDQLANAATIASGDITDYLMFAPEPPEQFVSRDSAAQALVTHAGLLRILGEASVPYLGTVDRTYEVRSGVALLLQLSPFSAAELDGLGGYGDDDAANLLAAEEAAPLIERYEAWLRSSLDEELGAARLTAHAAHRLDLRLTLGDDYPDRT